MCEKACTKLNQIPIYMVFTWGSMTAVTCHMYIVQYVYTYVAMFDRFILSTEYFGDLKLLKYYQAIHDVN